MPSPCEYSQRNITIGEELKSEALRSLLTLDITFLQDFCESQRKLQMMHLVGLEKSSRRYSDDLYLNRGVINTDFKEFLLSKDKCFLLTGKQGTGKLLNDQTCTIYW